MTGYFAEVRCEGRPFGSDVTASHVLGTFRTISPVLAVRWLRGQARHLAERLDPDPERAPWVRPVRSPADARPPLRHRIGGLAHPLHVLAEDPWR